MLLVSDINTLWRSRPFEALAELRPVLGLAPQDRWLALRSGRQPWGQSPLVRGAMQGLRVVLPMGWAGRNAAQAQPMMWAAATRLIESDGGAIEGLVVTSPHYLPLCNAVQGRVPLYYYCSDDYRSYAGWGGKKMEEAERSLVGMATHSFFVSNALRTRAIQEYSASPARLSVSMNATDKRFLERVSAEDLDALLASVPKLKRPIVGVVGGINDRLDFDLLARVAQLPSVGSLLFVGSISPESRAAAGRLSAQSSKVVFVGQKPHAELPAWYQLADVGLIPYARTEFNRFCSPMRLFDHLATGHPVVTTDACVQVGEFSPTVAVAPTPEAFLAGVAVACASAGTSACHGSRQVLAGQHTWAARAEGMHTKLLEFGNL